MRRKKGRCREEEGEGEEDGGKERKVIRGKGR